MAANPGAPNPEDISDTIGPATPPAPRIETTIHSKPGQAQKLHPLPDTVYCGQCSHKGNWIVLEWEAERDQAGNITNQQPETIQCPHCSNVASLGAGEVGAPDDLLF